MYVSAMRMLHTLHHQQTTYITLNIYSDFMKQQVNAAWYGDRRSYGSFQPTEMHACDRQTRCDMHTMYININHATRLI